MAYEWYADIFCLTSLLMDFCAVYTAGIILNRAVSWKRCMIACVFGVGVSVSLLFQHRYRCTAVRITQQVSTVTIRPQYPALYGQPHFYPANIFHHPASDLISCKKQCCHKTIHYDLSCFSAVQNSQPVLYASHYKQHNVHGQ